MYCIPFDFNFSVYHIVGNPKCNPKTWEAYNNECCSADEPCGLREGDCDNDGECHGELVCGKNNCRQDGSGFTRQADCCQLPLNRMSMQYRYFQIIRYRF